MKSSHKKQREHFQINYCHFSINSCSFLDLLAWDVQCEYFNCVCVICFIFYWGFKKEESCSQSIMVGFHRFFSVDITGYSGDRYRKIKFTGNPVGSLPVFSFFPNRVIVLYLLFWYSLNYLFVITVKHLLFRVESNLLLSWLHEHFCSWLIYIQNKSSVPSVLSFRVVTSSIDLPTRPGFRDSAAGNLDRSSVRDGC